MVALDLLLAREDLRGLSVEALAWDKEVWWGEGLWMAWEERRMRRVWIM